MIDVYDNGALMLGRVDKVIEEIKREIDEDLDMIFTNKDELLDDLYDIYNIDTQAIVCVDYENPMGYDIYHWNESDRIRK